MVQVGAVYLRELQDMYDKHEDITLTLKAALLSTGNIAFSDLFPDESADDAEAAKTLTETDEYGQTDSVTYKFTEMDLDPDQIERELRELERDEGFTVNGGQIDTHLDRIAIDWGDT